MLKCIANIILSVVVLLHTSLTSDEDTADQIHFSIINNTAVTFDWVGTADCIRYGTDSANFTDSVTAVNSDFLPVTSPWVSDPGPYWEAKLTGLMEDTIYFYRIGSNGQVKEFRTPPLRGKAGFRICSISDMHQNTKECVGMFNQIAGLKPGLVLTTGDLTGADSDGQQEVSNCFRNAMAWSLGAAWMPAWGNHDWENADYDDLRTYKGRFDIPNAQTSPGSPAVSCCGEDWGWFDYGNTRFISLPERWNSSTTWQDWSRAVRPVFKEAQDDPGIRFIITFGHQSAYTSAEGRYGGSGTLKTILNGLHSNYPKYKLDLSGHNHQYERYSLPDGMNYIINSTAGSYYRGWDSPARPDNCSFRAIHYGILVLDFSDNAIHGQFVCSAGTTKNSTYYKPLEEDVCTAPGTAIDTFTIYESGAEATGSKTVIQIPDDSCITNYPNPFKLSTYISYHLAQRGHVKIEIYDLLGRRLVTLLNVVKEKGEYTIEWIAQDENGNMLPGGLYIAQICTGKVTSNTRLILIQ
jgi:hypothetical protein